jgi:hypothetical protein
VKLTVNAFVGLDGTMQGPAGPEEYDNPFPPERGGWLVPFSDHWAAFSTPIGSPEPTRSCLAAPTIRSCGCTGARSPTRTTPLPRSSTITANMSCPPHSRRKRPPGPTLISDHMFERVAELTEMPGRELQVHGSLKLARSLHEAGLVDLSDC